MIEDRPGKSIRSWDTGKFPAADIWMKYVRQVNTKEPPRPFFFRDERPAGRTREKKVAGFTRNLAFYTSGAASVMWLVELAIGSMGWAVFFAAAAATSGAWGLRLCREGNFRTRRR